MRAVVALGALGWSVFVACAAAAGCSDDSGARAGADAGADARSDVTPAADAASDVSAPDPADAAAPLCVPGGPCPALEVSAANGHSCALLRDGTIWCWGENERAELGSSAGPDSVCTGLGAPVRCHPSATKVAELAPAAHLFGGGHAQCSIEADDESVWCWGDDALDMLGRDAAADDHCTLSSDAGPTRCSAHPRVIDGLPRIAQGVAGDAHTCVRTRLTGEVLCWGSNDLGALGAGAVGGVVAAPTKVPGLAGVVDLAAGGAPDHTCAVKGDGTVWCWGANAFGELGHDPSGDPDCAGTRCSVTPRQVPSLSGVAIVAAASGSTCAVKSDRTVWCWGRNTSGELGRGTVSDFELAPARVLGLPKMARIASGAAHYCGIAQDSSVWCWGANDRGQLGAIAPIDADAGASDASPPSALDAAASDSSTCPNGCRPAPAILAGQTAFDVAAFAATNVVLRSNGTVWGWGDNRVGELGREPGDVGMVVPPAEVQGLP